MVGGKSEVEFYYLKLFFVNIQILLLFFSTSCSHKLFFSIIISEIFKDRKLELSQVI